MFANVEKARWKNRERARLMVNKFDPTIFAWVRPKSGLWHSAIFRASDLELYEKKYGDGLIIKSINGVACFGREDVEDILAALEDANIMIEEGDE